MRLLIKNCKMVDCGGTLCGDMLTEDGKILSVGKFSLGVDEVLDLNGLTLMPAFVDMHAHFRDPGLTQKEDIYSGCRAAAKGGYTFVNLMANTDPVCSEMQTVEYVLKKAGELGIVDVHQTVSLTKNFDGRTISHLYGLDGRVRLISDDGRGVMSNDVMAKAMEIARKKGLTVLSHAEDMEISPRDYRLAENIATVQHLYLSWYLKVFLHICHVSTKEAMQAVICAKKAGAPVSCEVTPHHIWFYDNPYRVNPPLRSKQDRDFLIDAVKNGFVDAIATDHAPHTALDKKNGAPGMVGLETAFGVCYTALVKNNRIPLGTLSRLMSRRPAEILGLNKGRLLPGYDADFAVVDEERVWRVDAGDFVSKGKNSAFDGATLTGKVVRTIKAGKTTWCE